MLDVKQFHAMLDVLHLEAQSEPELNTGCRLWFGAQNGAGYGHLSRRGRHWLAHRLSYALSNGEPPDGLYVFQTCENRACINPAHLVLKSSGEAAAIRARRGTAKGAPRGEANAKAKLSDEKVREIRESTRSIAFFADKFGVSEHTVLSARRRLHWKHVP